MYLETLSDNFEHMLLPADDSEIQAVNTTQEVRNKVRQETVGADLNTTHQSDSQKPSCCPACFNEFDEV